MSRLIGGLQSLTSKVTDTATRAAAGLGDGVAKVANKTEEAAKRVNRTVNPLSSHFQQPRDGGSSGSHAAGSEVNESAGRGEGSFVVAGDGMSIKEAKVLAESIKDAVTGEIEALHEEKREHLGVLHELERLAKEQDEAYRLEEEQMETREETLLAAIRVIETNKDAVTVIM